MSLLFRVRAAAPGMFMSYTMLTPCELLIIGEKHFSTLIYTLGTYGVWSESARTRYMHIFFLLLIFLLYHSKLFSAAYNQVLNFIIHTNFLSLDPLVRFFCSFPCLLFSLHQFFYSIQISSGPILRLSLCLSVSLFLSPSLSIALALSLSLSLSLYLLHSLCVLTYLFFPLSLFYSNDYFSQYSYQHSPYYLAVDEFNKRMQIIDASAVFSSWQLEDKIR